VPIHSLFLRVVHSLNAVTVLGLIASGWAIYNASPFYSITFPVSVTLGGYLTEALRWHFTFIWIFLITSTLFIGLRVFHGSSNHGPTLIPISHKAIQSDLKNFFTLKLEHPLGEYNHIQRFLYVFVFLGFVLLILSGLGLWKPVQFQLFNDLVGGYEMMRRVHFWSMASISAFVIIHLTMVMLAPKTLLSIFFGLQHTPKSTKTE